MGIESISLESSEVKDIARIKQQTTNALNSLKIDVDEDKKFDTDFLEKGDDGKYKANINRVKLFLEGQKNKTTWEELTKENSGALIKAIQIALKAIPGKKQYNLGQIDGILGEETKKTVAAFQKENNIEGSQGNYNGYDGVPGPKTIAKILELLEITPSSVVNNKDIITNPTNIVADSSNVAIDSNNIIIPGLDSNKNINNTETQEKLKTISINNINYRQEDAYSSIYDGGSEFGYIFEKDNTICFIRKNGSWGYFDKNNNNMQHSFSNNSVEPQQQIYIGKGINRNDWQKRYLEIRESDIKEHLSKMKINDLDKDIGYETFSGNFDIKNIQLLVPENLRNIEFWKDSNIDQLSKILDTVSSNNTNYFTFLSYTAYKAMKGLGTAEKVIKGIFNKIDNTGKKELIKTYKNITGEDLISRLRDELSDKDYKTLNISN